VAAIVRLSQDVLETLSSTASPSVRVSQDVLETLSSTGSPTVRITQDVLEVLYTDVVTPMVLITQDVLEVLYSEDEAVEEACFAARLAAAGTKVGALLSDGVVAGRVA
jgi:hypothetical protein